jgi:hypothetical protein
MASKMNSPRLLDAMQKSLLEGEMLLECLDDAEYCVPCPEVFHACIGGHFRHLLDHYRNLLECSGDGVVNYDLRDRDTPVETERVAGLGEAKRLRRLIESLDSAWLQQPLRVRSQLVNGNDGCLEVESTMGREAAFCIMHAVHHYALIRIICRFLNRSVPANFGIAPSTIAAGAMASASSGNAAS